MTPAEFCRWLQGFAELTTLPAPTPEQWKIIKDHLQLLYVPVVKSTGTSEKSVVTYQPPWPHYDPGTKIC